MSTVSLFNYVSFVTPIPSRFSVLKLNATITLKRGSHKVSKVMRHFRKHKLNIYYPKLTIPTASMLTIESSADVEEATHLV